MLRQITFAWILCIVSASLFHPGRKLNTAGLKTFSRHSLISNTHKGFKPSELFGVSRRKNTKCGLLPIERTVTLAESFEGDPEDVIEIDRQFTFFKLALGWSAARIERSRREALRHFKTKFGLDLSSATLNSTTGEYEGDGVAYGSFVFTTKLVKIADSARLTRCPKDFAIYGGWLLFGIDVTYPMIPGVQGAVKVPGESALFFLYIVFRPGSKFSTAIKVKGTRPSACTFGVCQVAATTEIVDDYYGSYTGNLDGIAVETFVKPGVVKSFTNLVLSWPRRD